MSVSFLERPGAPALAYRVLPGDARYPTIVFLTGFRSDMEGTKAAHLASWCAANNRPFVRFDYRGHGQSGGRFEDGTIGIWRDDALAVIDTCTSGPLILAGSSMGGWIALLAALARPQRVAGILGLAAAPDFTRAISMQMNDSQRKEMNEKGFFFLGNDYDAPYPISRALLEEGDAHILLNAPINITCPVRLIQGMKDTDVPWQTAHRIKNALVSNDVIVHLREDGDHRLSSPDDLALMIRMVEELSARASTAA
jgi:pimeloyl-ACP methyl ester carboxylesterase